jgi:tRNA pseudouridine13 synthase
LKDQLIKFHQNILSKPDAKAAVFGHLLSSPITDKSVRGRLHQDVRRIFESHLETQMLDEGIIQITAAPRAFKRQNGAPQRQNHRNQSYGGQSKGKVGWDEQGGQFLHFSLYKENKDTMEVISYIATRLHVKPKDFAFAGTKDRRAVTVQRVSVFRQNANTLAKLNHDLRNARIGDFKHEKHKLELGELDGNQFIITLRDCHFGDDAGLDGATRVKHANEIIGQAVKHLQNHGFINYYGLQRFGTFNIGTDDIGKMILQGDFKGAVDAILVFSDEALNCALNPFIDPSEFTVSRDDIARAHAIHMFKTTGKSNNALEKLPRKFSAESAIIRHLGSAKAPNDYLGALLMINRNLRTMYVHAYQSLVWNMVASERWARYGDKVIEGDLVIIDTQGAKDALKDELDENGEIVVHPAGDDVAVTHDDLYERARPLTAEEAASGKYTIFDIVLPTPGYDMEYPGNDIGDFYKTFMGSERGGRLDPADMRRNQKDFSLSGNYRYLMAQVGMDLSFEVKVYHEELEQLVETDLEKLDKLKAKSKNPNNLTPNDRNQTWANNGPQNNRGGRGGSRGGSSGNSGNQSQYRGNARQEAERNKVLYAGTSQLNAWQNLPGKLAAEDKAAAAIAEVQREAQMQLDPATIKQPVIKDTWIQTSTENEGRRTGYRSTVVIPGAGGADKEEDDSDTASVVTVIRAPVAGSAMNVDGPKAAPREGANSEPAFGTVSKESATGDTVMFEYGYRKPASVEPATGMMGPPSSTMCMHRRYSSTETLPSDSGSDGGVKLLASPQKPAQKGTVNQLFDVYAPDGLILIF